MRPTTLLSLCVFVMFTLLATQARPAHSALILPLVIYKKLPKHDPTQHLKSLLQFINLDVIKGLVGQLINFEAILRPLLAAGCENVDRRFPDHGANPVDVGQDDSSLLKRIPRFTSNATEETRLDDEARRLSRYQGAWCFRLCPFRVNRVRAAFRENKTRSSVAAELGGVFERSGYNDAHRPRWPHLPRSPNTGRASAASPPEAP
ncbi:hypothetical protein MTO96_010643 [Rhipicephalus appendiculatus]